MHQPFGGAAGQAEDIRLQAEQIIKAKNELFIKILARHTRPGDEEAASAAPASRDK